MAMDRASLVRAYRAGKKSSLTSADSDDAAARWSTRHCRHDPVGVCSREHAWWDGFGWDCRDLPAYMVPRISDRALFQMDSDGVWTEVAQ